MVEEVSVIIENGHHHPLLDTSPFSVYVLAFPKLEQRAGLEILDSIPVDYLKVILRGLD